MKNLASACAKARCRTPKPISVDWRLVPVAMTTVVMTVAVVVVTAIVALLPPMAVMMPTAMAIAGLLNGSAVLTDRGQLAENVAGGRGGLRAADSDDGGKCTSDSGEGENSLHFSSFFSVRFSDIFGR
jgi:hypothetical protein